MAYRASWNMPNAIGRPWERERLQLERGSHGESCGQRVFYPTPAYPKQSSNVGRKYKNDSQPISFVFGEKYDQERPEIKKEPTETESNMGQADVKKELSVTEEIVAQSINWVSDARQKNSLNGLNWVSNSDRGQVLLQMMEKMGYEYGKGLGKDGQGIVEPINPNPNLGKKALGSPSNKKDFYTHPKRARRNPSQRNRAEHVDDQHERIGLGGAQNHMMADLKTAKQMHMRDNITNSLKTAGFTDQTSSEIYEAIGVLAKHHIMPLGMGLGLVKKMLGGRRRRMENGNFTP